MENAALPKLVSLAVMVSELPDSDIESISVTVPTTRFEGLSDSDHALQVASDLIEEAVQTAYDKGSVPAIEIWGCDLAQATSTSVHILHPDEDDYEDAHSFEEAKAERSERLKSARRAVALLVKTVLAAVLAADPQPPLNGDGQRAPTSKAMAYLLEAGGNSIDNHPAGTSMSQEVAFENRDTPHLADLLYASLGAKKYVEPDIWTHPGTGETQVSFDLRDTTHVIVSVSVTRGQGARLCITANRLGDEDDPGLCEAIDGIHTPQHWVEAVQLIQARVDALARGRVLA